MTPTPRRVRRLTPLRLLIAVALLAGTLAVGAHEVAIHSQPCYWAMWPVSHCEVAR